MQSPACGAFAFYDWFLNAKGTKDSQKTQKRENTFLGFFCTFCVTFASSAFKTLILAL